TLLATAKRRADHQKRTILTDFIAQLLQLIVIQRGRGHVDEIAFGGITVLPIDRVARSVDETLQLAYRLSQHGRIKLLADNPVAPLVLFQQRRREAVITETTATFPADRFRDAARVFAIDYLLET